MTRRHDIHQRRADIIDKVVRKMLTKKETFVAKEIAAVAMQEGTCWVSQASTYAAVMKHLNAMEELGELESAHVRSVERGYSQRVFRRKTEI
jgi:predicted transcriptional regulator